jgi:hypothetical protein
MPKPYARLAGLLAAACAFAACGQGDRTVARKLQADPLDAVVQWIGDVVLEEDDASLSVLPMVSLDPRGGFLVADLAEAQIRRYDPVGRLLWRTGRKGGGPGEFTAPAIAARLPSGGVLVMDRPGRLTTYDSTASRVLRTVETRLNHVEEMALLGDTLLLIGGVRDGNPDGPRLHLWDLRGDSIARSFFSPLPHARNRSVAYTAGWTRAAVRGDTVAATFAASDTLYFFALGGRTLGQAPLASHHFRRGPARPPEGVMTDPAEQARYLGQFDVVEGVHWLTDGTLLVPYQSLAGTPGTERRHHLVHMTREGRRLSEARDTPRLLQVDPSSGLLYFVHPEADAPNRWSVARLR